MKISQRWLPSGGELEIDRELNCKKPYYIPKDAEFCPLSEYIMPHSGAFGQKKL